MEITQHIGNKIRGLLISFTLLISLFFVLLLLSYSWLVEDNVFNRLVAEEAKYIQQTYTEKQQVTTPRLPFMTLYRSWSELPENIQLLRSQSPDRIEFPLESGGTLHLTLITLGQSQWILAADVSGYEVSKDYLPTILKWIVVAQLGIGLISFFIARYLADHIVKPIQSITNSLQDQDNNQPLAFEHDFAPNEIGYLAASVESSFNRLQQSLERESQFTRDISHELRTPAAVLKMIAEKLKADTPVSDASKHRLNQAVVQIEQTLNVLLALAREESLLKEKLNLKEEMEYCIINHFVLANDERAELHIDIDPGFYLDGNRNLLHILINNLLDNGVNHGIEINLTIQAANHSLKITNPAQQAISENLFEPQVKSTNSHGLGLGLHLVKRICQRMGWEVDVENNGKEFSVCVLFEPAAHPDQV